MLCSLTFIDVRDGQTHLFLGRELSGKNDHNHY